MVYWLLLAGSLIIGYPLCKLKYKKIEYGKIIYCVLFGIAFFVVAAIRRDVGYDYNLYGGWFNNALFLKPENLSEWKQEKGFLMPMKLIADFFVKYQAMFVVIAFIVAAGVMFYIYKYSEKPYLSVFFFLSTGIFFNSMDFMRQIIAAVIIMYAFRYIKSKQFFRFFVIAVFASMFHVSALIMIPFYFILLLPMSCITLGIYSAATVLIYFYSWDIFGFITGFVYQGYHSISETSGSREFIIGGNPIYAIMAGIFLVFAFLLRKELVKKDSFNNVYLNCIFLTFAFEFLGTKHAIVSRLAVLFFIPAFVILLPRAVTVLCELIEKKITRKNLSLAVKTLSVFLIVAYSGFMYGYMIENNYNGVSPYQTIYDTEERA